MQDARTCPNETALVESCLACWPTVAGQHEVKQTGNIAADLHAGLLLTSNVRPRSAVVGGLQHLAEGQVDAGPWNTQSLGHRMHPVLLHGAAHDQHVPGSQRKAALVFAVIIAADHEIAGCTKAGRACMNETHNVFDEWHEAELAINLRNLADASMAIQCVAAVMPCIILNCAVVFVVMDGSERDICNRGTQPGQMMIGWCHWWQAAG